MSFERSVFVNCPFDEAFFPLLRPLLFTIIFLGLKPRIALEASDSGEARLEKILALIRASKFGIHDLSRCEASKAGELYRLNMPFELGLDFGCRTYGRGQLREKKSLVLEAESYRYKAALSDLSGADIEVHKNEPYKVVTAVRNWLRNVAVANAAGATKIWGAFNDFMAKNYDDLIDEGFSAADIEALPVFELMERMTAWKEQNI
ncbi:hypothetical protein SAMN05518845_11541 [Variovorax sp. YR750]|uniref:hypothetical protein n=1 Tax=Variovorax sp. YR750 TaxID=1884384 RepID=UPI0008CC1CB0|nr:hypothetical protein [Variovorax sp. YR750]SEM04017.1 hypothetical protein SAMN05518845_11541 [Variovorax sp. YR750]